MDLQERVALFSRPGLYVVITQCFCGERSSIEVLEAVLDAGVQLVQLREKDLEDGPLYRLCLQFRERTRAVGALLIVDDRVDIALAAGADGVHLGQADLPITSARALAPDLIIGASSHNLPEALQAQEDGASYVNIGPIFPTQTKSVPTGDVGPVMIDEIRPHLTIPFTCMGGIKAGNIQQVLDRGARHVAVVTAVTAADRVREAAEALHGLITNSPA